MFQVPSDKAREADSQRPSTDQPKTLVIWNSHAGSAAAAARVRHELMAAAHITVSEPRSTEETLALAATAADYGYQRVVAAGGDGTLHTVINGLREHLDRVELGILPIGTGNDLARTLAIPLDIEEASRLLLYGRSRRIDLVRVHASNTDCLFANSASGGNSHRVVECLDEETKATWGPWCYLRGAISVLMDLVGFEMTIVWDNGEKQELSAWNAHFANGRTVAGGLRVAPLANPEDGMMDVVIIRDGSPIDTARLATEFALGDYLEDEQIVFRRTRSIRIESEPAFRLLADGEIIDEDPVTLTVLPRCLQVLVGPQYRAAPVETQP